MNLSSPKPSPNRPFLVALAALTIAVYFNTLLNGFTIDDEFVYSGNHWVRSLGNLPQLFDHDYFQYSNEASYRPVCTLTYFLDAAMWEEWPCGPHLTNLVLYVGVVFLVYFLCKDVTGAQSSALFGAALFALHPIHTEAVNNISFREDLLIGLFLPASWLLYKRSHQGHPWLWMPLAWLCYFLATMSKEMAVVFPLLVLLLEVTETQSYLPNLLARRRIVFMVGLLVITAVFALIRFRWMRFEGESHVPLLGGSIYHALLSTTKIQAHYLLLFFCPYQLRALYPPAMYSSHLDSDFFIAFSGLIVFAAFLVYFRRERMFVLGVLWWFVSLVPVSNLYPIFNPMAERYLLLPSVGLCIWVGWLIGSAYEAGRRGFLLSGSGVLALILGTLTFLRNPDWHDNLRLWKVTAENDPANPRVLANLAAAYYNDGNYERAIDQSSRALVLLRRTGDDFSPVAIHVCLASSYFMQGKVDSALLHAQRAEPLLPARFDIDFALYRTLGLIYDAKLELAPALKYYRRASEIDPYRAELWRKISFCELRLGSRERAMEAWRKAREIDRNVPRFEEIETLYEESRDRPPI